MIARLLFLVAALTLGGCDAVTALMADPKAAQRVADSKAIGSACRYGLRSIEDCYSLNERASKAAIFDGWKEMDQYMRENKIEGIVSKASHGSQPAEEVIEEKAAEDASKNKPGADATAKTTKAKPAEKPAH